MNLTLPGMPVALEEWKSAAEAGQPPAGALLRKQFVADEIREMTGENEGESRRLAFIISTASVDRERDTIAVEGWRLENYRRNPVVLWAHSYRDLPVGRAVEVSVADGRLTSVAEFPTREVNPFADTVYQMLRSGYLRATSVGFAPVKWVYNQERRGVDFLEQELLEYSVVPVPANPEALQMARAAGIDLAPIKTWAEAVLDEWHEGPGLWLPKGRIEQVYRAVKGGTALTPGLDRDAVAAEIEKALDEYDPAPTDVDEEPTKKGAEDTAAETAVKVSLDSGSLEALTAQIDALTAKVHDLADAVINLRADGAGSEKAIEETYDLAESDEEEFEIEDDELRALVRDAVQAAVTRITGRLD